jgi:hypothetical protein
MAVLILTAVPVPASADIKIAPIATQAQVLTRLVKTMGLTKKASAAQMSKVKDVKKNSSYYTAVSKALKAGLIKPDSKGKIYPTKKATFKYVVTLLSKATGISQNRIRKCEYFQNNPAMKMSDMLDITTAQLLIDQWIFQFKTPKNADADEVALLEKILLYNGAYSERMRAYGPEGNKMVMLKDVLADFTDERYYAWNSEGHITKINWGSLELEGALSFSGFKELEVLWIDGRNNVTSLDVTGNTQLWSLSCAELQLEELDLSTNTKLTMLDCADNKLKKLDLSTNVNLIEVVCTGNQLTTLDIRNCPKLSDISIDCDEGVQIISNN